MKFYPPFTFSAPLIDHFSGSVGGNVELSWSSGTMAASIPSPHTVHDLGMDYIQRFEEFLVNLDMAIWRTLRKAKNSNEFIAITSTSLADSVATAVSHKATTGGTVSVNLPIVHGVADSSAKWSSHMVMSINTPPRKYDKLTFGSKLSPLFSRNFSV